VSCVHAHPLEQRTQPITEPIRGAACHAHSRQENLRTALDRLRLLPEIQLRRRAHANGRSDAVARAMPRAECNRQVSTRSNSSWKRGHGLEELEPPPTPKTLLRAFTGPSSIAKGAPDPSSAFGLVPKRFPVISASLPIIPFFSA